MVPRCTGVEWFDALYAKALLRITVPVYREVGSEGHAVLASEMVALIVSFGYTVLVGSRLSVGWRGILPYTLLQPWRGEGFERSLR